MARPTGLVSIVLVATVFACGAVSSSSSGDGLAGPGGAPPDDGGAGSSGSSGQTPPPGSTSDGSTPGIDGSSPSDAGYGDADASSACSGTAPATVSLPLPAGASGTWIASGNGGALVNVPHPTSTIACTACHTSCGSNAPNTIIGYDHGNPALVCNYCHDPGTKVVATTVKTGSMAVYHSSVDSQVCTCCHNGTNNVAHGLPADPATPIVPSSPACTGTSAWQLVFPTFDGASGTFKGGQFFGGT
jgi:hypothetical protein